jgi:hypothetical protein
MSSRGRRCHRLADFAVVTTLTKSYDNPSLSGVNHLTAASPILKWAQSLVCSGHSRRLESIRCQLLVHTPNGRRMFRMWSACGRSSTFKRTRWPSFASSTEQAPGRTCAPCALTVPTPEPISRNTLHSGRSRPTSWKPGYFRPREPWRHATSHGPRVQEHVPLQPANRSPLHEGHQLPTLIMFHLIRIPRAMCPR